MSSHCLGDSLIRETNYNVLVPKTPSATVRGQGDGEWDLTQEHWKGINISTTEGMTPQNCVLVPSLNAPKHDLT